MGCRLSRTQSIDSPTGEEGVRGEKNENGTSNGGPNNVQNGKTPLLRKDSPATGGNYDCNRNGVVPNNQPNPQKPIGDVESASQADFFRMLDEKIAGGPDLDSEMES